MNVNNMEIERKFLVKELPENLAQYEFKQIKQGYISTKPTIRIRQQDHTYILTVKGKGAIQRQEFEMEIEKEQFDNLLNKVEGGYISKKRYIIPFVAEQPLSEKNLIIELDIYEGDLQGFMNVEVEFSTIKDAILFEPPQWFGEEVTNDRRYSNASLVKFGIPEKN